MNDTNRRVYACIQRHYRENGCGPTCREISAEVGICLSTVYGHLRRLERDGLIGMGTVEGITLLQNGREPDSFANRL